MKERITPYLQNLIRGGKRAIKIQFRAVPQERKPLFVESDPLGEESRYDHIDNFLLAYSRLVANEWQPERLKKIKPKPRSFAGSGFTMWPKYLILLHNPENLK